MAASYPSSVKSFSAVTNGVTKLVASLFTAPYEEVVAIETELGINVAGSAADLVTRLAVCLNDDGTFQNTVYDYGTATSSPSTKTMENVKICYGRLPLAQGAAGTVTGLPFTSASSYQVAYFVSGTDTTAYCDAIVYTDGTQFVLTLSANRHAETYNVSWIAIGT